MYGGCWVSGRKHLTLSNKVRYAVGMFINGTKVKVAGYGCGIVTDLTLENGYAFAVVEFDNGETRKVSGTDLQHTL